MSCGRSGRGIGWVAVTSGIVTLPKSIVGDGFVVQPQKIAHAAIVEQRPINLLIFMIGNQIHIVLSPATQPIQPLLKRLLTILQRPKFFFGASLHIPSLIDLLNGLLGGFLCCPKALGACFGYRGLVGH